MFKYRPRLTQMDKLCLIALVGCFMIPHLAFWAIDGAAIQAAEKEDKPTAITITAPSVDCTPLVEAVEARKEELFWSNIPLDTACREALQDACDSNDVPICLALGVIHAESRFDPDADNGLSYGLMGLNRNYYPSGLTHEENIWSGVEHLAGQIERYDGDIQAALRAYNNGWDDGDRVYARIVLDASEKWGNG